LATFSANESWLPKNITLKHIQWSYENYSNKLTHSDIGIVPNGIMTKNSLDKIKKQKNNLLNLSKDDYVLRFKMPSGPGRIIVFGLLGIPVISDFFPSGIRHLQDGRGLIAHSTSGWEHSFKKLIVSSNLRKSMGQKLQNYVIEKYDFISLDEYQNNLLNNSGSSSIKKGYPNCFSEEYYVQTIRFDDWYNSNSIGSIDFVWIDVQGAEYEVIDGMGSTIQNISYIWMEYGEDEYDGALGREQTINLLKSKGFKLVKSLSSIGPKGDLVFKYKNWNFFSLL